jgi:hypothetical protein
MPCDNVVVLRAKLAEDELAALLAGDRDTAVGAFETWLTRHYNVTVTHLFGNTWTNHQRSWSGPEWVQFRVQGLDASIFLSQRNGLTITGADAPRIEQDVRKAIADLAKLMIRKRTVETIRAASTTPINEYMQSGYQVVEFTL